MPAAPFCVSDSAKVLAGTWDPAFSRERNPAIVVAGLTDPPNKSAGLW